MPNDTPTHVEKLPDAISQNYLAKSKAKVLPLWQWTHVSELVHHA